MKKSQTHFELTEKIGISEEERKAVSEGLEKFLADTYALYLQTQNFHWNVRGPQFGSLHKMFEEQYQELAGAVDVLAERIRALGFPVNATFSEFLKLMTLEEEPRGFELGSEEMILCLLRGQEQLSRTARALFMEAQGSEDQATADLLSDRMAAHEKMAWMLRSSLSGS